MTTTEQIHLAATRLKALGVKPGDRVALLSSQPRPTAVAIAACLLIEAVPNPLSTRYTPQQVQAALGRIRSAILLADSQKLANLADLPCRAAPIDELHITPDGHWAGVTFDHLRIDPQQPGSILMTSGSSGTPRPVLHRIEAHQCNARGASAAMPASPDDCRLLTLPLYHISGFALIMRAMIDGSPIAFPQPDFSLLQNIITSRATHLSLVPTQLFRLINEPRFNHHAANLKAILLGGAPAPTRLIHQALDLNLPLHTTYGSTEAASQIATTTPGSTPGNAPGQRPCEASAKQGSTPGSTLGTPGPAQRSSTHSRQAPGPGNALKTPPVTSSPLLRHPNTVGRPLPFREIRLDPQQQLLLRGPILADGCLQPDGSIRSLLDSEGWYATGDLARINDEQLLFITGRLDAMFISGGENIHPEEIEQALASLPDVERTLVCPVPDPEMGHRPVAFVRLHSGRQPDAQQLLPPLAGTLERFKRPIAMLPWPQAWEQQTKINRQHAANLACTLLNLRQQS